MKPSKFLLLLTLFTSLLVGCASHPLPPVPKPDSVAPNAKLWHWQVQGRLAINDGQERHSANLDWQQQGFEYELMIFGPLGQGRARLEGQPFRVRLTTSDGKTLEASSPEQLIREGLGWDLPLSNLIYWVRGLPAPGEHLYLDTQLLRQGHWEVEWRRFTEVEGYQLPSLIIARQGNFELRLAVNTWTLHRNNQP
ncbi:outer membrane lipoprotein LolB [Marinospirillum celere]|uniref:Outer-membrane lipoprotein LolB n=1 Tax=Marinospirillum celere TaxID=1122252 RepID=A0A1I1FUW8_9GAMM|nr:lipoprotein insertase outer membrane protein LolB [Marinospirillum celere]SFC03339.1 outer membrane lipoprotein LolB [Marinospirillum celere]